jgi:hypothetical protein
MIKRTSPRPIGNARSINDFPTPAACALGRTNSSVSSNRPCAFDRTRVADQRFVGRILRNPPLCRVNHQVFDVRLQREPKRIRVQHQRLILPGHQIAHRFDSEVECGS